MMMRLALVMSNRKALKRLSRRFPPPKEIAGLLNDLPEQDDRTIAIVGGALIESVLERVLIAGFPSDRPDLYPVLFENRGPLSDMHSKILLAEAFGLITPIFAKELQIIKHVRNAFAHSVIPITFETKEVAGELRGLRIFEAIQSLVPDPEISDLDDLGKVRVEPRAYFVLAVTLAIFVLDSQHRKRTGRSLYR